MGVSRGGLAILLSPTLRTAHPWTAQPGTRFGSDGSQPSFVSARGSAQENHQAIGDVLKRRRLRTAGTTCGTQQRILGKCQWSRTQTRPADPYGWSPGFQRGKPYHIQYLRSTRGHVRSKRAVHRQLSSRIELIEETMGIGIVPVGGSPRRGRNKKERAAPGRAARPSR